MNSLSPSRPLIIMMVGIPGAGKSYFGRQFAETFNAPLVSFDEIQHTLFPEPQFSKDEEALIAGIMSQQIKQLIKTEKTFLVDGGLNTRIARSVIERLGKPQGYGCITIWVQTDMNTAGYRATHRNQKRPGDLYNSSMDDEIFTTHAKRINPPEGREPHVVISGRHTFASQAKAVLKKIVTPRDVSPSAEPRQTTVPPGRISPPRRRFANL